MDIDLFKATQHPLVVEIDYTGQTLSSNVLFFSCRVHWWPTLSHYPRKTLKTWVHYTAMTLIITRLTRIAVMGRETYATWMRACNSRPCSSQFCTRWPLSWVSWATGCCWEFCYGAGRLGVWPTPSSSIWVWQMSCCWWRCPCGLHRPVKLLGGTLAQLCARSPELFSR